MPRDSDTALLLMAHGSRNAAANEDLFYFVKELTDAGDFAISEGGFLELAEPDIASAGRQCVARGAKKVLMVPYFLSAGVHVQKDIAQICAELQKEYPDVVFVVADPIGRHSKLTEILLERALDAIRER